MLKEARIVMPMPFDTTNNLTMNDVFQKMEWEIARNFGSFTVLTGESARVDVDTGQLIKDTVRVYDIAMESGDTHDQTLRTVACRAAYRLQQKAVYIRYAYGSVEIVDLGPWAAANIGGVNRIKPAAPVDNGDEEVKPVVIETERKPEPGQIWETRAGALVAVLNVWDCDDGYLQCVTLRQGPETWLSTGERFKVNRGGWRFNDAEHPTDLRRFKATF